MIPYDMYTHSLRQTLPADNAYQEPIQVTVGSTVRVNPGSGGTVSVLYTLSPLAEIDAGTAIWYVAPLFNSVTVAVEDVVDGRINAIKAKQSGGVAGYIEVCR
ncbi:MAG: hypothetical protein Q8O79_00835 [Pseudomonadota bacterium]|nr:hypothetical protein [Pseudomonadota bacterium]